MTLFWEFYLITAAGMTAALMVRSMQLDKFNEKSIIEYIIGGLIWPLVLMGFLTNKQ